LADDLKAAESDALKKAASLFGVGLYLYSSTGYESNRRQNNANGSTNTSGNQANQQDRVLNGQKDSLPKQYPRRNATGGPISLPASWVLHKLQVLPQPNPPFGGLISLSFCTSI